MRAIIDTCVVIDALQARAPYAKDAEKIFLAAANRHFTGYLTAKSITDIYYITHRSLHDSAQVRKALSALFQLFEIADSAGIDCKKALSSPVTDYEDAVMAETAIRIEADCIVTRNMRDYANAIIPVYTPENFLAALTEPDMPHET